MLSTPPAATASPYLHTDPTDLGQKEELIFCTEQIYLKDKEEIAAILKEILKGKPFKEGPKERSKGHLYK